MLTIRRHSIRGQMCSKWIAYYEETHYVLTISHICKSIVDGVEATAADVLSGKVYETEFLCDTVLAKHYDTVRTVATVHFNIHNI